MYNACRLECRYNTPNIKSMFSFEFESYRTVVYTARTQPYANPRRNVLNRSRTRFRCPHKSHIRVDAMPIVAVVPFRDPRPSADFTTNLYRLPCPRLVFMLHFIAMHHHALTKYCHLWLWGSKSHNSTVLSVAMHASGDFRPLPWPPVMSFFNFPTQGKCCWLLTGQFAVTCSQNVAMCDFRLQAQVRTSRRGTYHVFVSFPSWQPLC